MPESPYIYDIDSDNFETVIIQGSHQVPVLVDFWAEWCGPCKTLMPLLAQLAEEYQGQFILAKINTEQQQAIAAEFAIRSIPTVKLFRDGTVVDEFMGALPESEIRRFLEPHIPRVSDGLVTQIAEQIHQGNPELAANLLEQATLEDPDNPRLSLCGIQIKAMQGDYDAVDVLINDLPPAQQDEPEIVSLKARIPFARATADAPAEAELMRLAESDSHATYQLAALRVSQGDFEAALELLIGLMQRDRSYGEDAARKGMLSVFEILGSDNPLVGRYRNRMFNILH